MQCSFVLGTLAELHATVYKLLRSSAWKAERLWRYDLRPQATQYLPLSNSSTSTKLCGMRSSYQRGCLLTNSAAPPWAQHIRSRANHPLGYFKIAVVRWIAQHHIDTADQVGQQTIAVENRLYVFDIVQSRALLGAIESPGA